MSDASPARRLTVVGFERSRHRLAMRFRVDDLCFNSSYWYEGVDLPSLELRFGEARLRRIYFHIVAFEAMKLLSLHVRAIDFGPFAGECTPAFEALFRRVFQGVFAQWRYENEKPGHGPEIVHPLAKGPPRPLAIGARSTEILALSGGGKDSLVATKLLERAGVPYASLAYSHSTYGAAAHQHRLLDDLLDRGTPVRRHRQWVIEDFLDSPVAALEAGYGVRSLAAAETPASLFAALPVVLAYGYRVVALAHERSANSKDLVVPETGEEVNHQWGKSREAEALLGEYLRKELLSNVAYFSVLQPVYDLVIFQLLKRDLAGARKTHSCNVRKPWCKRCPKCAYVWLGYYSHLPRELVDGLFGENLLEAPATSRSFRQILGLEPEPPFDCIGDVDEVRLLFELCLRKGLDGPVARNLRAELGEVAIEPLVTKYLGVDAPMATFPVELAARLLPQMHEAARAARDEWLGG